MIEVTNLTKKYGDHTAVDNLSFTVEKGQIYGFLGPNGAGKSTTMNIITGYLAASSGRILINGKDIQKEPEEAKRAIGYLPELPPLYVDMTVEEYLQFVAELKRVPKKERQKQLAEVMEMTQITDKKKRLIKNLSKGYKQRVGLAQAILGDPEIIILDEPTVGLDPKQMIEIRDLIRHLGENHTVILSSHILSEVSAVCDRIMIIAHGRLVASDSPEGLQKLMNGTAELELIVKGSFGEARDILYHIPEVETVENKGTERGNCVKLRIVARENADIREQVFFAMAEARMPIMGMTHFEKSLEDIFLELTEAVPPEKKEKRRLFGTKRVKVSDDCETVQVAGPSQEAADGQAGEVSDLPGEPENAVEGQEKMPGEPENAVEGQEKMPGESEKASDSQSGVPGQSENAGEEGGR